MNFDPTKITEASVKDAVRVIAGNMTRVMLTALCNLACSNSIIDLTHKEVLSIIADAANDTIESFHAGILQKGAGDV
jgi:hypothetical protein